MPRQRWHILFFQNRPQRSLPSQCAPPPFMFVRTAALKRSVSVPEPLSSENWDYTQLHYRGSVWVLRLLGVFRSSTWWWPPSTTKLALFFFFKRQVFLQPTKASFLSHMPLVASALTDTQTHRHTDTYTTDRQTDRRTHIYTNREEREREEKETNWTLIFVKVLGKAWTKWLFLIKL